MSHPARTRRRVRAALAPIALVAVAAVTATGLAACSSGKSSGTGDRGTTGGTNAANANSRTAAVTVSAADGCTLDRTEFTAGPLTFAINNTDATAVTEVELLSGQRIVGEKENLPAGFTGNFAVEVTAGEYTLYCPGAKTEKQTIKVTGTAASTGNATVSTLLDQGAKEYATYVNTQIAYLVDFSRKLATALAGTDLAAAQVAYMKARPYYEKVEPVAESFTVGTNSLDADIDARANDVPASRWTGFHRIEKGLFASKSLTGLSGYGEGLVQNVLKLQTLAKGLTYKPFELANGAQELLDEVASTKITGEEERYSHIDMLDFANNVEGAEQAFASLQPGLTRIDATLTKTITDSFGALDTLLDTYRTTANASGYVLYTALTNQDKQKLAAAVKAVQEPLSQVAGKVAGA